MPWNGKSILSFADGAERRKGRKEQSCFAFLSTRLRSASVESRNAPRLRGYHVAAGHFSFLPPLLSAFSFPPPSQVSHCTEHFLTPRFFSHSSLPPPPTHCLFSGLVFSVRRGGETVRLCGFKFFFPTTVVVCIREIRSVERKAVAVTRKDFEKTTFLSRPQISSPTEPETERRRQPPPPPSPARAAEEGGIDPDLPSSLGECQQDTSPSPVRREQQGSHEGLGNSAASTCQVRLPRGDS